MNAVKNQIRKEYYQRRKSVGFIYKLFHQRKILKNFIKLLKEMPSFKKKIVGVYYPIGQECDTLPLIKWLHGNQIRCALPKIIEHEETNMVFILFDDLEQETKKNPFGAHEPCSSEEVAPNVFVLPLITCDRKGNRLGYGKGFYDRYIQRVKRIKKKIVLIGLCYERQVHDADLPKEAHDQKLNFIVTEKNVYKC